MARRTMSSLCAWVFSLAFLLGCESKSQQTETPREAAKQPRAVASSQETEASEKPEPIAGNQPTQPSGKVSPAAGERAGETSGSKNDNDPDLPSQVAEPGRTGPEQSTSVARKLSGLRGKRQSAEKQKEIIIEERKNIIEALIQILQDKREKREVRIRAAYLLGEYRAEEGLGALFENLDLTPAVVKEGVPEVESPCMVALVKIGKKASLEALNRVSAIRIYKRGEAYDYYWIMIKVEGKEVAAFLVRQKLKKAQGKEKENLEAFLKEYFSK